MERGNLNGDAKRKGTSVRTRPKYRSTIRGGPDRSSVEALVMRVERRVWAIQMIYVNNSTNVEEDYMKESKSQPISKRMVWNAFKSVKANRGGAGIDGITLQKFEENLSDNLYKLWNRMTSGSYFPPPVKEVLIPKRTGGFRKLGIPTVSDRIAQAVVKMYLEPRLEQIFHPNSFGYRPGRSAHDALKQTRSNCWRYNWVIDLDIKGFFDHLDHELLMKALEKHFTEKWVLMYVERWLKASVADSSGQVRDRKRGTPQGGVISPCLSNLFLHYALDVWLDRNLKGLPFQRYADDLVLHCRTYEEAKEALGRIRQRLVACGLSLNEKKTHIVYCADSKRRRNYPKRKFTFLGYTFQPRMTHGRRGRFLNFGPAISKDARKEFSRRIRRQEITRRTRPSIDELAKDLNKIIRGYVNYFGLYSRKSMYVVFRNLNIRLIRWVRRKYKRFQSSKRRAKRWLQMNYRRNPKLFAHWEFMKP